MIRRFDWEVLEWLCKRMGGVEKEVIKEKKPLEKIEKEKENG